MLNYLKIPKNHSGPYKRPSRARLACVRLCFRCWNQCRVAKYLDPALNDSCRIITGCLKPTNTNCLYLLAGIAPPDIRREVISRRERCKAMHDPSHILYGSQAAHQRLKSRKSFLYNTPRLTRPSEETRFELWKDRLRVSPTKPALNIEPAEAPL